MGDACNELPMTSAGLRTNMRRRTLVRLATAMAAGGALTRPHVAHAAVRTITLSQIHPASSQFGQGCLAIAGAVARHPDLANVLRIEVHHDAEFGDEVPMLADCRAGTLDMVATATFCAADVCEEVSLLDMPFVFKSLEHGRATFDGPVGVEFAELLRAKDVHVVGWLEHGLRQLTANRPIRNPTDLSGIRLRVPQSPIVAECFRTLGANIHTMPFKQVYEALRGQIIDAQENPIATVLSDKFYEVQKYLCLTGHIYSAGMVVASGDLLGDLTPLQRTALQQCAVVGTRRSREVAGLADREGLAWLRNRGMVVIDDIDRSAFFAACRPVIDRLGQRFGADRVARLTRAAG